MLYLFPVFACLDLLRKINYKRNLVNFKGETIYRTIEVPKFIKSTIPTAVFTCKKIRIYR